MKQVDLCEYCHACKLECQQEKANLIGTVEESRTIMTHSMPVDVLVLIYIYHLIYASQQHYGACNFIILVY